MSAAFIGSGVGLALGACYLATGMGAAAADHRAERIALADRGSSESGASVMALAGPQAGKLAGLDPDAVRMTQTKPTRARELDCLAQAVYFEARGESPRGQAAVATVIMNRVKNPNFPKTVCGVVYQGASHRNGCQFSFACDGTTERVVEWNAWERARKVAARTLSGAVLRDIGSATHFHTTGVDPDWGSRMLRTAQVGLHVFYRFNPHAPRPVPDDDDAPVFVSRPAPDGPELRLAAALVAPLSDAAQPAKTVAIPDVKPAVNPEQAPSPIAKSDMPAAAKADAATAS